MNKTTEALKIADLVEASVEECMGDDGMVAVIPLDLYNELIEALAAIREVLAEQIPEWVDVDDYEEPVKQEPVSRYAHIKLQARAEALEEAANAVRFADNGTEAAEIIRGMK